MSQPSPAQITTYKLMNLRQLFEDEQPTEEQWMECVQTLYGAVCRLEIPAIARWLAHEGALKDVAEEGGAA